MHMCDYCCWFVSTARGCECPWAMRNSACEKAAKKKEEAEGRSAVAKKNNAKTSSASDDGVVRSVESLIEKETTCSKCGKIYKKKTTTDYNSAGMHIEYSICPDCGNKNMIAWHVW